MPLRSTHLSENDKCFLKALRIAPWVCPCCTKAKLRIEEKKSVKSNDEDTQP